MTRKQAQPSLLSRGAPADHETPAGPWWRNDEKLLQAVIRRAAEDRAFGKKLMNEAAAIARSQSTLKKELEAALKGARPGARRTPLAELMMISDMDALLSDKRGGYAKLVEWVSSAFSVAERGAKARIKKAREVAARHQP